MSKHAKLSKKQREVTRSEFKASAKQVLTVALIATMFSSLAVAPVLAHAADASHAKDKSPEKKNSVSGKETYVQLTDPSPGDKNQTKIADAMLKRMATGKSNQTAALVCAGGGTSGAVSAGSACALHDLAWIMQHQDKHGSDLKTAIAELQDAQKNNRTDVDMQPMFDQVFASSVGALVHAYMLSGNTKEGAAIFSSDLNEKFLSVKRVVEGFADYLQGKEAKDPGMNLSFLKEGITGGFGKEKTLNLSKIVEKLNKPGAPPYYIVVTDKDTFESKMILANGMSTEQLLDTTMGACNILGVGGPTHGRDFDAKYTGQTVPLDKANADTVLVLDNAPDGRVGFDGPVAQAMNQFVIICSCEQLGLNEKFSKLLHSAEKQEARNEDEIKAAQKNTGKYLFLGTPQGDKPVSSSELDKTVLKDATQRAYLNTMSKFVKAGIDSGEFTLKKGETLRVYPDSDFGNASNYLKITKDAKGDVDYKIAKVSTRDIQRQKYLTAEKKTPKKIEKNPKTLEAIEALILPENIVKEVARERRNKYGKLNRVTDAAYVKETLKRPNYTKLPGNSFNR